MWQELVLLGLFLVFVVAPLFTWVEERRHFKRLSFVRTIVVVQAWILLTSFSAFHLAFCKHVLRQDVRVRAHEACGAIARLILRIFFDGYEVLGRENVEKLDDKSAPMVIVANHQSMLDVAAIFCLELKGAWVAKTTVFMIPGVGWLMYMAGYVPVERKSSGSIKRMYDQCRQRVKEGWSLVIFPQGTRSRATTLPFKNGAYNLAAELSLPVLPVSIHIADDAWLNGSKIRVRIHPPVLGCDNESLDAVREGTFDTIVSSLQAHHDKNLLHDGSTPNKNATLASSPSLSSSFPPQSQSAAAATSPIPSSSSSSSLLTSSQAAAPPQQQQQQQPAHASKVSKRGRGTALILKATTAGTGLT